VRAITTVCATGLAREPGRVVTLVRDRKVTMFEGLFQPTHLILILLIATIFFGPKKLPELGKGLGEGIRGFREAMKPHPPAVPPAEEEQKKISQ
jgi:sec-independent protein translocase protein TatA